MSTIDPEVGLRQGRRLLRAVGLVLIGAGVFAVAQSALGRILPHDLRYVAMSLEELCGLGDGRVLNFMFHDRTSFGGAIIAIGCLYIWLEQVPMRGGERWAWGLFFWSGLAGFGSFLAYLGYGYLDTLHGAITLCLLPLYAGGLWLTRPLVSGPGPERSGRRFTTGLMRLGIGRALLQLTGAGFVLGGVTIMLVGMTDVFVPQDLKYMGIGANDLRVMNRRLIPLIAHDRAAFGGAIVTCGILFYGCARYGKPCRSLWRGVLVAGGTGFVTAIGVHPLIGYTDVTHLAPAYAGAVLFFGGMVVCYRPMCGRATARRNWVDLKREPGDLGGKWNCATMN